MADYKARESIGELGTSYAEEEKRPQEKKKMGVCLKDTEDMSKVLQIAMFWVIVATE